MPRAFSQRKVRADMQAKMPSKGVTREPGIYPNPGRVGTANWPGATGRKQPQRIPRNERVKTRMWEDGV